MLLLLPHAKKCSSASLGRVSFFSLVTILLYLFFDALCWSISVVFDFDEKLGRTCFVRSWVEIQRFLGRLQIDHLKSIMIVLHVNLRLVLRVGVWIQWRHEWEIHWCPAFACAETSWYKTSWCFLNRRLSRIYGHCACYFRLFVWENVGRSRFFPEWLL